MGCVKLGLHVLRDYAGEYAIGLVYPRFYYLVIHKRPALYDV